MTMKKKYIAGWEAMAARYDTTLRNVQRMTKDGRLPEPVYMGGNSRTPLWELEALDEHDRLAIKPRSTVKDRAKQRDASHDAAAA